MCTVNYTRQMVKSFVQQAPDCWKSEMTVVIQCSTQYLRHIYIHILKPEKPLVRFHCSSWARVFGFFHKKIAWTLHRCRELLRRFWPVESPYSQHVCFWRSGITSLVKCVCEATELKRRNHAWPTTEYSSIPPAMKKRRVCWLFSSFLASVMLC